MFLNHRKKLTICHCMPGRMRVKAEPIRASRDNAAEMEKWLSAQAHLFRIQACPATANVILYYTESLFTHSLEDLRQGKGLSIFPFLASACVLAIVMGESMAALEVIWIFRIGMLLEDYVSEKSKRAIRETFQVADPKAYVLVDGAEIEVETDSLRAGEIVVVRTGEKIPADGVVIAGEALVDEAHITGRAVPEMRIPDHQVFAGTFVRNGMIHIRAEKTGDDTYLSRTLRSVEASLANRAPVEKQADILAMRLFRLGILAVAGTFVLTADPIRAVTVMIVMACPCATVLAASTAVSAALVNAARNRSLIKGGCYLETVGKADCYCFDKTGTITEIAAGVADVLPLVPGQSREDILRLAASLVSHHPHPVAKALTDAAAEYGISLEPPLSQNGFRVSA